MRSVPSPAVALALALAAASLGACDRVIDLLPGDDLALPGDGPPPPDLALDLQAAPDLSARPTQVHFGDEGDPARCAASLAAALHRQALCACTRLQPQGAISTSAIDSTGAGVDPTRLASVASNGSLAFDLASSVGGSLYAVQTITVGRSSSVHQTLHADGDLRLNAELEVDGDLWIGGAVTGNGNIETDGTFHLTAQGTVPPEDGRDGGVNDRKIRRDFQAAGPQCNCDPSVVAIPSLVATRAVQNDNLAAGLQHPGDLANLTGARTVDLPAGQYYLTSIGAPAGLTLQVHGPAALFVDGAIALGGDLGVRLDAGASLDLVFTGTLTSSGGLVGSDDAQEQPARVRLWASTSGLLSFSRQATVSAALYAPTAQLSAPQGLNVHGAALVGEAALAGSTLHVAYDRALNRAGGACGLPPATPL